MSLGGVQGSYTKIKTESDGTAGVRDSTMQQMATETTFSVSKSEHSTLTDGHSATSVQPDLVTTQPTVAPLSNENISSSDTVLSDAACFHQQGIKAITAQGAEDEPETPKPDLLTTLTNPNSFTLEDSSSRKHKITKADFINKTGSIQNRQEDPSDPFSQLDPLWTLKEKQEQNE